MRREKRGGEVAEGDHQSYGAVLMERFTGVSHVMPGGLACPCQVCIKFIQHESTLVPDDSTCKSAIGVAVLENALRGSAVEARSNKAKQAIYNFRKHQCSSLPLICILR